MYSETSFYRRHNHVDIISDIYHKLRSSPLIWSCRHIKGHQYYHIGPLDRWSTLNVEFDSVANDR